MREYRETKSAVGEKLYKHLNAHLQPLDLAVVAGSLKHAVGTLKNRNGDTRWIGEATDAEGQVIPIVSDAPMTTCNWHPLSILLYTYPQGGKVIVVTVKWDEKLARLYEGRTREWMQYRLGIEVSTWNELKTA